MTNVSASSFEVKKNLADDYTNVSVPYKMKGARVIASIDMGGYTCTLVSLTPVATHAGMVPRTNVVRFRANTKAELKEKILKEFPDAVFSKVEPRPVEHELIKAARLAIEKENSLHAQQDAQKQLEVDVIKEHRTIAQSMSAADQEKFTNMSLSGLQNEVDSPYRQFLHDRPNFLSWPNNSYENRSTLLKYCQQKGSWPIPTLRELIEGFKYCLEHNHFHMKSAYKRSDVDTKNAVRPFDAIETANNETDLNAVISLLKQKYGVPLRCDVTRIKDLGYDDEQAAQIFDALKAKLAGNPVSGQTAEEMKAEMQQQRAARGPRTRASAMSGY